MTKKFEGGNLMRANLRRRRSQAALDFMVSYGVVLLALAIAVYVVFQLGILNPRLTPSYCTPAPSFSCISEAMFTNGTLIVQLAQTSGGVITINGMACSTAVNATGNAPRYGNINVLGYSAAPAFYPNNALKNGVSMGGDQPQLFSINCYGSGGLSKGPLGNTFIGYVWINYTYSALPSSYYTVEQALSFSTAYT